ncbi:hypothetical protein [Haloferula chungangensis]|uniref:hypothetical protein n=1 Tax=Haloferula chungangensis TaxID=1048331 RepID=UPI0036D370E9
MAEIYRYRSSAPSFSEVLEILSNWSEREALNETQRARARGELELCLEALREKTDEMSLMVRGKVQALLKEIGSA